MATWIIFKIALRNVFSHKLKTIIVGVILTFGALLAILGSAFVDAVAGGMKNSTTQSITGDIQIYSDEAKEKLSVFGNMDGSPTDVGHINEFLKTAQEIKTNPKVKEVIPMGTSSAFMNPGNILDYFLEKLRKDYKKGGVLPSQLNAQKKRLQYIVGEIQKSLDGKLDDISFLSDEDVKRSKEALAVVRQQAFWDGFDSQFEQKLEYLSNKIAPLIFDANMIFFNYLGTHPQMFQKNFSQFEIVKGEMIPEGNRGFLFHDYFYENFVKHRIARTLDQIKKALKDSKTTKIATSKELKDKINTNIDQSAEIFLQLGPVEAAQLVIPLQKITGSKEKDFRALIKDYLNMNDENFQARYDFFYKEIAPKIILYRVQVGEVMPVSAMAKTGSATAVNLKVYGTFRFKSFENSPLAGNFSIMDLVSFRELYGFVTDERRAQNKEIESEMNIKNVSRDDIESLFSGVSTQAAKKVIVKAPTLDFKKRAMGNNYSEDEILKGPFMHAAVILNDSSDMNSTVKDLINYSKEKKLGFKAVNWQDAAGMIGQMTAVMKGILYFFISISLLVAGLMIVNSLLMAAMDRKQEIGTMRAIGAGSDFIYKLFFFETLFISLIFGILGALIGGLIVIVLHNVGIPASGDVATFFFSGPRLYLKADPVSIFWIVLTLIIMAIFATQYPAWKAVQVSPIQAMQKKE